MKVLNVSRKILPGKARSMFAIRGEGAEFDLRLNKALGKHTRHCETSQNHETGNLHETSGSQFTPSGLPRLVHTGKMYVCNKSGRAKNKSHDRKDGCCHVTNESSAWEKFPE